MNDINNVFVNIIENIIKDQIITQNKLLENVFSFVYSLKKPI